MRQSPPGHRSGTGKFGLASCVILHEACHTLCGKPRAGPGLREQMSQSGVPIDPGAAEEPKRKFFSQKGSDQPGFSDPRIEAMLSASHRLMMERLEEGLEAIEETATSLMREVAGG